MRGFGGFIVDCSLDEDGLLKIFELGCLIRAGLRGYESLYPEQSLRDSCRGKIISSFPKNTLVVTMDERRNDPLFYCSNPNQLFPNLYTKNFGCYSFLRFIAAMSSRPKNSRKTLLFGKMVCDFPSSTGITPKRVQSLFSAEKNSTFADGDLPFKLCDACGNKAVLHEYLKGSPIYPRTISSEITSDAERNSQEIEKITNFLQKTPANYFVLKPTNQARARGVVVLYKPEVIPFIRSIINSTCEETYWKEGKCNPFLLQVCCPSKEISVKDENDNPKSYRATIRLVFASTPSGLEFLGAYWKLPEIPFKGELTTDNIVSRISSRKYNTIYSAKVEEEDLKKILEQFNQHFLPVYKKMVMDSTGKSDINGTNKLLEEMKCVENRAKAILKFARSLEFRSHNESPISPERLAMMLIGIPFELARLRPPTSAFLHTDSASMTILKLASLKIPPLSFLFDPNRKINKKEIISMIYPNNQQLLSKVTDQFKLLFNNKNNIKVIVNKALNEIIVKLTERLSRKLLTHIASILRRCGLIVKIENSTIPFRLILKTSLNEVYFKLLYYIEPKLMKLRQTIFQSKKGMYPLFLSALIINRCELCKNMPIHRPPLLNCNFDDKKLPIPAEVIAMVPVGIPDFIYYNKESLPAGLLSDYAGSSSKIFLKLALLKIPPWSFLLDPSSEINKNKVISMIWLDDQQLLGRVADQFKLLFKKNRGITVSAGEFLDKIIVKFTDRLPRKILEHNASILRRCGLIVKIENSTIPFRLILKTSLNEVYLKLLYYIEPKLVKLRQITYFQSERRIYTLFLSALVRNGYKLLQDWPIHIPALLNRSFMSSKHTPSQQKLSYISDEHPYCGFEPGFLLGYQLEAGKTDFFAHPIFESIITNQGRLPNRLQGGIGVKFVHS